MMAMMFLRLEPKANEELFPSPPLLPNHSNIFEEILIHTAMAKDWITREKSKWELGWFVTLLKAPLSQP